MTFILRPQNPNQTYCNAQSCQQARKRQWQKDKLHYDLDYRINQQAAQQTWAMHNPDYWRHYREGFQTSRHAIREIDLFLEPFLVMRTPPQFPSALPLQPSLVRLR
ncbi:hypothetical protein ACFO0J_10045 [Castellaniella hirudinis]|uniref:Uncharacterized protein n=1 Tax=Castellaniella hirudinis TaxID=1144617 RepID=A0ABV8RYC0_9BURK